MDRPVWTALALGVLGACVYAVLAMTVVPHEWRTLAAIVCISWTASVPLLWTNHKTNVAARR